MEATILFHAPLLQVSVIQAAEFEQTTLRTLVHQFAHNFKMLRICIEIVATDFQIPTEFHSLSAAAVK